MSNGHRSGRLGILVGGGPAPGINSTISSVTIEARNSGLGVVGIYDGWEHLIAGDLSQTRELMIEDVSRIHYQGGSILRTSRENPTKDPETQQRVVDCLKRLGVTYLVTIGGDDTAFAAASIAHAAKGTPRIAHIPKTIDNDLPLPGQMPTFGYESARDTGTQLVLTLMEDSRTTNRWFVVVVMGRKAGHLALGIGKAAGATLTIIPEEFREGLISLDDVSRVIEGSIIKRRQRGLGNGVAVVAEGVGERIAPEELKRYAGGEVGYDPYGNVTLADIPLAALIKERVQRRFAERDDKMRLTGVTLGYELRCTRPNPFDIDYTRTLGNAAVKFLLDETSDDRLKIGGFITLDGADLGVLPFEDLLDAATGRMRIRLVDIESMHYRVARDYMIRIEREDLDDAETSRALAEAAHMTPEAFGVEFSALFANERALGA